MRYEAMQLLQFLFTLALIVGAFAVGLLAGWYRWAPRTSRPVRDVDDIDRPVAESTWPDAPSSPRSTLFSPEGEPWPSDQLSVGGAGRSPRTIVLPADVTVDLRDRPRIVRGELGAGHVAVAADDTLA